MIDPMFILALLIWIFIGFAFGRRRSALISRMSELLSKPLIFYSDDSPDIPYYPRSFFERLAIAFRDFVSSRTLDPLSKGMTDFIKRQLPMVYSSDHPMRTAGSVFFLVCTLLFIYADSVAIAHGLETLGYIVGDIPSYLQNFDIAVGVTTILSIIIGFLALSQVVAESSEISSLSDMPPSAKRVVSFLAVSVILLSLFSSILLGIARLFAMEIIVSPDSIMVFVQIGIITSIMIGNVLAAAITFYDAFRGVIVVFIMLEWLINVQLYIMGLMLAILGSTIPVVYDMVYRILVIAIDVIIYLILAPIDLVVQIIKIPFRR